ncbi:MAG: SRPBCC family protein, partial [Bdellovibrionales bacterium]|nr:SRPBCC family protein [Bdellovibrionales bacterium]
YRLSLNGVPFSWQTRIEDWVPGKRFVDTQLKGPYSLWHHTHDFLPMAGGTLLRDRVHYRLPMGILGSVAAGWKVVRDVDTIFKYRRKVIHEKFGKS